MNLGDVRVNTDLHRFHAQCFYAICFLLANQNSVGFQFYAERPQACVLQNFEKVPPHQNFAAADRQIENAGIRHLGQQVLDLRGGHLAVIVVVEIAVNTPLVATIRKIQLHAQRNVHLERLSGHFRD